MAKKAAGRKAIRTTRTVVRKKPAFVIEIIPLDKLKADPENANLHNEKNIEKITRSLRRFGQQKNIVVLKDGTIIAGNGTYEAAVRLGLPSLSAYRTELSYLEAKAYGIIDNRSSELSEWNFEKLKDAFEELSEKGFNLEDTGFEDHEIGPIMGEEEPKKEEAKFEDDLKERTEAIKLTEEQYDRFCEAASTIRGKNKKKKLSDADIVMMLLEGYGDL